MNQQATAELRRIAAAHGGFLRPADVIEEAHSAASPLHRYFEWDNTEAARLYRLQQAEALIRVSVVLIGSDPPKPTRCFVSLSSDRHRDGGYRETVTVLSDDDLRRQLLSDARREMDTFRRKYQHLQELSTVIQAIHSALGAA